MSDHEMNEAEKIQPSTQSAIFTQLRSGVLQINLGRGIFVDASLYELLIEATVHDSPRILVTGFQAIYLFYLFIYNFIHSFIYLFIY